MPLIIVKNKPLTHSDQSFYVLSCLPLPTAADLAGEQPKIIQKKIYNRKKDCRYNFVKLEHVFFACRILEFYAKKFVPVTHQFFVKDVFLFLLDQIIIYGPKNKRSRSGKFLCFFFLFSLSI